MENCKEYYERLSLDVTNTLARNNGSLTHEDKLDFVMKQIKQLYVVYGKELVNGVYKKKAEEFKKSEGSDIVSFFYFTVGYIKSKRGNI